MQSPARKVNVTLAACGLVAGFCATLGFLSLARSGVPTPTRGMGAVVVPSATRSAVASAAQALASGPRCSVARLFGPVHLRRLGRRRWGVGRQAELVSGRLVLRRHLPGAGPAIGFSRLSGFLHNSVVVQTAAGRSSRLVTLTGGGACDGPGDPGPGAEPVVQPPGGAAGQRDWDADGIRVGGTVVKFYNAYLPGPVPYIPVSTTIASFGVSQLSAAGRGPAYGGVLRPELTPVPSYTPPGGGTPIVWGSALLPAGAAGRTVYVYGWQSPDPASAVRELYLARVSAARLTDVAAWRFYDAGQWAASQSLATPVEPDGQELNVASGFSVAAIAGRYWLIQAAGSGNPDIDAYPASAPWGPFDRNQGIVLYRAPGIGLSAADDYRILYEARAEPALSTSQALVISYNVNSEAVTAACISMAHYTNAMTQPRFIAVPASVFGAAPPGRGRVLAAPARYPAITQHDPAQWFSAWSFPGGCPPVPPVSGVTARTSAGGARLTWPAAGLGVRYRVYVKSASGTWVRVRTVSVPRVAVTGLVKGLTYQFEVMAVNIYQGAGPPAFVTALAS